MAPGPGSVYRDVPDTTVDTDYVGDLQIGDVYFRWTVEQGIDPTRPIDPTPDQITAVPDFQGGSEKNYCCKRSALPRLAAMARPLNLSISQRLVLSLVIWCVGPITALALTAALPSPRA